MVGLVIENGGKVYDLLSLFSVNRTGLAAHPVQKALRKVWRALRRRQQNNKLGLAAKNVQHHYDIPTKFYELWLDDTTMTYSRAYYTAPDNSLNQAQMDKHRHIAAKLKLEPGMHVAEIRFWLGRARHLPRQVLRRAGHAINVSTDQLAASRLRAAWRRASQTRSIFREVDYREVSGQFDRPPCTSAAGDGRRERTRLLVRQLDFAIGDVPRTDRPAGAQRAAARTGRRCGTRR